MIQSNFRRIFFKYRNKVEGIGIGNVLVFVHSEHGKTFGGYHNVPYEKPEDEICLTEDQNAYIFKFDHEYKCELKEGKEESAHGDSLDLFLQGFGECDFFI